MIYLTLFLEFFKIGLFSFGGAFGMIPLIKEVVLSHEWMNEALFYDLIGVCESTPGPIAVNMATYIGSMQAGLWGSITATLGVVTPSFIIILLIAAVLKNLTKNEWFRAIMEGVSPVVICLILSTGLVLLLRAFGVGKGIDLVSIVILFLLTCIYFTAKYVFKKKIATIPLILISIVLGIVVSVVYDLLPLSDL